MSNNEQNSPEYYLIQIDKDFYLELTIYELDKNDTFEDKNDTFETNKLSPDYTIVGKIGYNKEKVELTPDDIRLIEDINEVPKFKQYDLRIKESQLLKKIQKVQQVQGGKNSQYIMTKQGKRKIHVGKRGGKYYIMNKKKVYVK